MILFVKINMQELAEKKRNTSGKYLGPALTLTAQGNCGGMVIANVILKVLKMRCHLRGIDATSVT